MRTANEDMRVVDTHPLLQEAARQVLRLYQREAGRKLIFHHYAFAVELMEEVTRLQEWEAEHGEGVTELLPLQLAALFFPTGRLMDYTDFNRHSRALAQQWLQAHVSRELQDEVLLLIQRAGNGQPATRLPEQLLADAVAVTTFLIDPDTRSGLLKLERELFGQAATKEAWTKWWHDQLMEMNLYSQAAQIHYASVRSACLQEQHRKLVREADRQPSSSLKDRPFDGLEARPPMRAAQTYFRVNYRNHINLSSIADNKANIMISVNSILISILVTSLTYGNVTQVRPIILLPSVVFILTGALSLIFAIFSARPKVTQALESKDSFEDRQRNVMFFGSFVHMDLDQYEEALDSVLHEGQLLYGNMARDLYFLGKVLDKKYRYLSLSYNIFMAGLVVAIISFLLVLFF